MKACLVLVILALGLTACGGGPGEGVQNPEAGTSGYTTPEEQSAQQ
ncbi:MAG: hypothetical protein HUU25_13710 [Candidatus Sumerlaeia bacterium]|nr:hypothetical protein [Candidatus Sumerlaeia bacterium]